jgi:hypothetical protein
LYPRAPVADSTLIASVAGTTATLLAGLGGALIGGRLTLQSARVQVDHDMAMRRHEEARRLRERGAEVVGPALTWLEVAAPPRVVLEHFSDEVEGDEKVRNLEWRLGEIRAALDVFAASHPSAEVATLAQRLSQQMSSSWWSTTLYVVEAETEKRTSLGEKAAGKHKAALETAAALVSVLREGHQPD